MYTTSFFSLCRDKIAVLLVTLMGVVILSSCSQDEGTQLLVENETEHVIKFNVNLKSKWITNQSKVNKHVSRGLVENEFSQSFGLFSGYYETADEATKTMNYMYNDECGESMTSWQTARTFFFPPANRDMSFYAYYPYQEDDSENPFMAFNGGVATHEGTPYFEFTIPDAIEEQVDLMVASTEMASERLRNEEAVKLHFSHLLTAVRFTVDESVPAGYIRNISINNVSDGGTYYFDGTQNWYSVNTTLKNYTLTKNIRTGIGSSISLADEDVFIMMPQALDDEASVSLTFDNGQIVVLTSSLVGKNWQPGKIVTYNIKFNSLNSLALTTTIIPWEDGDTFNWTSEY